MTCEFNDGLKIDYSGSLRITKGEEINVFVKEGFIPANIREELEEATRNASCGDFREIAGTVTATVGKRAFISGE
ncbi:MAG TPA: hypothetical protein VF799_08290 [Geobacteraceae bacterium]